MPRTEKARTKKTKEYLEYLDTLMEQTKFLPEVFNLTPRVKALQQGITKDNFNCPVCGKNRRYRTKESIFSLTCDKKDKLHNSYIQEQRQFLYEENMLDVHGVIDHGQIHYNRENLKLLTKEYFEKHFLSEDGYVKREEFAVFLNCNTLKAFKFARDLGVIYSHRPNGGFDPNKPATLYYLLDKTSNLYKIGITNRSVGTRFFGKTKEIQIIKTWSFKVGENARSVEKALHSHFKEYQADNDNFRNVGGYKEFFNRDVLTNGVLQNRRSKFRQL